MKKHNYQHAFTLVELLIVIVVIALLAAISVVAYNGIQARARASSVSSALAQTKKKIALWQVDNGTNSPSCSQFYELITGSSNGASCPFDYKDITYQYSNTADTATYCITATSGNTSYKASNTLSPTQGGCSGHGQGGTAAVTNLAVNPSLEAVSTGWGGWYGTDGGTGAMGRKLTGGHSGVGVQRVTWGTAGNGGGVNYVVSGLSAGITYTTSTWVRTSKNATIYCNWQNGGGTNQSFPVSANTWTRVSCTGTVPAGSSTVQINSYGIRAIAGDWIEGDDIMVTEGASLYNYADGNSPDWVWNGTQNNSTSTGPSL